MANFICQTCDKKSNKSEIPAQTVSNKLDIFNFPDDLTVKGYNIQTDFILKNNHHAKGTNTKT